MFVNRSSSFTQLPTLAHDMNTNWDGSTRRWRPAAVAVAGSVVVLVGAGGVSAQATPTNGLTDQAAVSAAATAAADAGAPAGIGVTSAGVSVPVSGAASVVVTSPAGVVASLTARESHQSRMVDGAAVADTAGAKIVSQAVAPGEGRHSIAIDSYSGSQAYSFDVTGSPDQHLALRSDGSVALVATDDGVDLQVGSIAKPWAVAADGTPVSTRFDVAGSTLTQSVDPTATTSFPVVADPRITFGRSVEITLTGAEANAVRRAAAAVLGVGVKIGCSAPARAAVAAVAAPVGTIASSVLTLGCKYGEAALVAKLFDTARQHGPYEDLKCYAGELLGAIGGKLSAVDFGDCKDH